MLSNDLSPPSTGAVDEHEEPPVAPARSSSNAVVVTALVCNSVIAMLAVVLALQGDRADDQATPVHTDQPVTSVGATAPADPSPPTTAPAGLSPTVPSADPTAGPSPTAPPTPVPPGAAPPPTAAEPPPAPAGRPPGPPAALPGAVPAHPEDAAAEPRPLLPPPGIRCGEEASGPATPLGEPCLPGVLHSLVPRSDEEIHAFADRYLDLPPAGTGPWPFVVMRSVNGLKIRDTNVRVGNTIGNAPQHTPVWAQCLAVTDFDPASEGLGPRWLRVWWSDQAPDPVFEPPDPATATRAAWVYAPLTRAIGHSGNIPTC
jgi:hypothetical protein